MGGGRVIARKIMILLLLLLLLKSFVEDKGIGAGFWNFGVVCKLSPYVA